MIFKRIQAWFRVIFYFVLSFRGSKATFLNLEETCDFLCDGRKSFIRYGDGELALLRGTGISYQLWSFELQQDLEKVKTIYEKIEGKGDFLIGWPCDYFKNNGFYLMKKRVLVASWSRAKYQFKKNFRQDIIYGEGHLFGKGHEPLYRKLWMNENHIIFVHNNMQYADQFYETYHIKTYFVQVPKMNAYSNKETIEEAIMDIFADNALDKKNTSVLISAGPVAKIIAFDLIQKGIRVLDTGHCWDDPLVMY